MEEGAKRVKVKEDEDDDVSPQTGTEFFNSLNMTSTKHFDTSARQACGKCGGKFKYYCYKCNLPISDKSPQFELPIDLEM